jgi:nitrogen-specific signal transduction histidine kinase
MKPGYRGHGRLVLLFLVAVILPSLALVILTLRMIGQERELAEKRLQDDRTRLAEEIGRSLLLRLENIKLQETRAARPQSELRKYQNPEVIIVCRVAQDRLILPWEESSEAESFDRAVRRGSFFTNIRSGEAEEFKNNNPKSAAGYFTRAINLAGSPMQNSYARLLLARVLTKTGETRSAADQYRRVLASPSDAFDEYGIPLALYACRGLLELGESRAAVLAGVNAQLKSIRWYPPPEAYLLRDLLKALVQDNSDPAIHHAAETSYKEVSEYLALLERVLALRRNFETLRPALTGLNSSDKSKPIWTLYGEAPWLVGLSAEDAESGRYLLAVNAGMVLESACSELKANREWQGSVRLVSNNDAGGIWLGSSFPEVRIDMSDASIRPGMTAENSPRSYYWLALFLVLSMTVFGSYVVWRDVRRELRTAEMRSQFVSSVSHELKTPLTAIRMFAETLKLGRTKNPESQKEYLDTIVNESERLTRLLNNVLDFSKIEAGRMTYRMKPTLLPEVIQAAARTMQYPLSQHGFNLKIEIAEDIPEIKADRDALEQAVLNLLNNAMKYSGESRTIDLRLAAGDGNAVIRVTDHGLGIDPQDQARIFEKFYRARLQENDRITGSGLGLALVDHVVKAHGGKVTVESAVGEGSIFSIYLPLEKSV